MMQVSKLFGAGTVPCVAHMERETPSARLVHSLSADTVRIWPRQLLVVHWTTIHDDLGLSEDGSDSLVCLKICSVPLHLALAPHAPSLMRVSKACPASPLRRRPVSRGCSWWE